MTDPDPPVSAEHTPTADSLVSAGPSHEERRTERRHTLVVALITGLVGVIFGGAATLGTTLLQIWGTQDNQEAEFAEQRAREVREHRTEVYFALLNAAEKFSATALDVSWCANPQALAKPDHQWCVDRVSALKVASLEVRKAIDQVYVYGSVEANNVADTLSKTLTLPLMLRGDSVVPKLYRFDATAYRDQYKEFLSILCQEVPPERRQNCGYEKSRPRRR